MIWFMEIYLHRKTTSDKVLRELITGVNSNSEK